MNKEFVQGKTRELKGRIKQRWGELTDNEVAEVEGNADILLGKLQARYGLTKDEARQQVESFRKETGWH